MLYSANYIGSVQMVWARSRLVGCGYATCPGHKYKTHVYCNYYPPYVQPADEIHHEVLMLKPILIYQ